MSPLGSCLLSHAIFEQHSRDDICIFGAGIALEVQLGTQARGRLYGRRATRLLHCQTPDERMGRHYYCYKKYPAIVLLACVDAAGLFTYVTAGMPGSAGDASTWNSCGMMAKVESGEWLRLPDDAPAFRAGTTNIKPCIVADSAFALSPHLLKCYDTMSPAKEQFDWTSIML
jgi:hypothetical protein